MARLFTQFKLRTVELPNRIVIAPMCQYSANSGEATDWHLMHVGKLAVSGVGLIIMEATAVNMMGRISPYCLALCTDQQEASLARVVSFCTQYGKAKLGIQLNHAGRKASTARPFHHGPTFLPVEKGGWEIVAPSPIPYHKGDPAPRELTKEELSEIKADFVSSTQRARRAGFDVLELHAAHGYLLNQFLSPLCNCRSDNYGGSRENRLRFPLEVFTAVRAVWPADLPIGVRLSAVDWAIGGTTLEDTVFFATAFRAAGADFIHVSSGGVVANPDKHDASPGFQIPFASEVRCKVSVPTIAVGGITTATQAEEILASGGADLVAIGRAALREPNWAWAAAKALGVDPDVVPQYARAKN